MNCILPKYPLFSFKEDNSLQNFIDFPNIPQPKVNNLNSLLYSYIQCGLYTVKNFEILEKMRMETTLFDCWDKYICKGTIHISLKGILMKKALCTNIYPNANQSFYRFFSLQKKEYKYDHDGEAVFYFH